MSTELYTDGGYLEKNPSWQAEDSPWKVRYVLKLLQTHSVKVKSICDVGCGAGRVIAELQRLLDEDCIFVGYDISPQAIELCADKVNAKATFKCGDILQEDANPFDLMLFIDVIEHIEDFYGFLREVKGKSRYKVFHIPLDLSAQTVLRSKRLFAQREKVGHIHYFTKETAIEALEAVGYEVVGWLYTPTCIELPMKSFKSALMKWPRKILFAVSPDFTARLFGGYSLMVLAK